MSLYKEEKIKEFNKHIVEEYNQDLIIEDIIKVVPIEVTDGKFTQIGIRPVIDEDIFIDPSFDERLPGAGRYVAIGERDFLINELLKDEGINKKKIKLDEFPIYIENQESSILFPADFYTKIFITLQRRIDYEEGFPKLDKRQRLIAVPERVIGNNIIVIPKDSISWRKKLFYNKFTNKKEKLNIKIGNPKPGGKVDITINSLNKIEHIDKRDIKILEIIEESLG